VKVNVEDLENIPLGETTRGKTKEGIGTSLRCEMGKSMGKKKGESVVCNLEDDVMKRRRGRRRRPGEGGRSHNR